MTELNQLTAVEAARRIAAGKLKSEDLVRDCLDRIALREPDIHAWAYLDPELAIKQARAVDRGDLRGLLAGVPVGVKDVINTANIPTECNSPIYKGYRPFADAACVAMVRRSGGIIMGKTVTTEFASRISGPTRNPHNLLHTPGGSSSGSGAAVADFMVPLAFGTQTGGSTIRPGAYCGIVAYKPSFGAINCAGLKHLAESLDTIGVMGRTVEDCALLTQAVTLRPMPNFSNVLKMAPRIGFCRTSRWNNADSSTQDLLERIASILAARGATVTTIELPDEFDQLYDDQRLIMNYEAARGLFWEYSNHQDQLSSHLRKVIERYIDVPYQKYANAVHFASDCKIQFNRSIAACDVLLTPSAPGEAPIGIEETGNSIFNRNWTLLGVPCVTLPAGFGATGLPLAVQLVGNYDNDHRLLECAEWVRQAIQ